MSQNMMLRGNLLKLTRNYTTSSISQIGNQKAINCLRISNISNRTTLVRTSGIEQNRRFSAEVPKNTDKAPPASTPSKPSDASESSPTDVAEPAEKAYKKTEIGRYDPDEHDDWDDEPRTAGEKVRWYTKYALGVTFMLLVVGLSGYVLSELLDSQQPTAIASRVFEILRIHDDIVAVTGDPVSMYGKDAGRNEGRRNHIDSRKYVEEDGSKRTRIRFNVKGPRGHFFVWVETSNKMAVNEYVYIICKDAKTGRVVTIQDNRDRLLAELEMPTTDGADALGALLGTFGIKR